MTEFQLTLPERGATNDHGGHIGIEGFNSRSPSGERQGRIHAFRDVLSFNSRSPSGERPPSRSEGVLRSRFQLTLPERGATYLCSAPKEWVHVSTHAPRAGSDAQRGCDYVIRRGFNSRSPSGERHPPQDVRATTDRFNSRSPSGERRSNGFINPTEGSFNSRSPSGERPSKAVELHPQLVSTHAPRAGSDRPRHRPSA